ncbi:phospholipase D family protein [Nitrincola tapanii]|uniref:Phospholipase D-like domain-containing protein n=1 Tax=Nitrincola tapanii TaxID=1708751 RepID=A0A5A9W8Y1_9GAMM|nr:phospholipase D family protein [Nitrincola tapanii]KAA0876469.1 hypothetical protein E1H14_01720 [Nitrincola tapanii]
MKLLKEFETAIKLVGEVKRVWMTTFNLNIELVETYLLPLILHASHLEKKPRTRMDYEAMQQVLGEKNLDVRVFCDKHFVELSQNKRTALPVHTVVPERLASNESVKFTKDSLFHPKVIYIEGTNGAQLGAGSANLTISGWARNREVFSFVPVDDGGLAASIRSFFEPLLSHVGEAFPQDFPMPSGSSSQAPVFCHSLAGKPFLDQLADEKGESLAVWSPYFPRDLSRFVEALLKERFSWVRLVPDLVQNQYIRTGWHENLKRLCEQQQLGFFLNPLTSGADSDDQCAMTHAKLWKTPSRRAVGSWNFTQPGSNLVKGQDKHCNIEAGLIFHDSKTDLEVYLGQPLEVNESRFASQALLDEESLTVPPTPPFDIQVFFDWSNSTYSVKGIWLGSEKPQPLTLTLPDLAHEMILYWQAENPEGEVRLEGKAEVSEVQALLKQRSYTAMLDKNQYAGLIIELHTGYRRAQEYPGLKELFDAFELSGGNPTEDSAPYRVQDEGEQEEAGESLMATTAEPKSKQDQLSYFRMFSFSQHYAQTLENVKDPQTLDRWVRIRPGCLLELHKKVKARIKAEQPSLFNWFLVQEVNLLVAKASDRNKKLGGEAEGSLAQCLSNLKIRLPSLPKELSDVYQEWLEEEYSRSTSEGTK